MKPGDDLLRHSQIAFQGKIIAAATHEFQNHLAVIKEYNGLISDLLGARKPDKKIIKRCVEISKSIEERSNRAARLTDTLNGFAHRGDVSAASFKVDAAVAELVELMQREAAACKVTLSAKSSGGPVIISNDSSLVSFLVYTLADHALKLLSPGGNLIIAVSAAADGAADVRISAEPLLDQNQEALPLSSELSACLDELRATISAESSGTSFHANVTVASLPSSGGSSGAR